MSGVGGVGGQQPVGPTGDSSNVQKTHQLLEQIEKIGMEIMHNLDGKMPVSSPAYEAAMTEIGNLIAEVDKQNVLTSAERQALQNAFVAIKWAKGDANVMVALGSFNELVFEYGAKYSS